MFRWLKDRSKKGRKLSTDSVKSKEVVDDYGFKQKSSLGNGGVVGGGSSIGGGGGGEYKRDLPPTPADLTVSCITEDDLRSLHIYEEIPDLPFRCTPEGELRISLAREEAFRRRECSHNSSSVPFSQNSSSAIRNISPYMVVPLELRHGNITPEEFRKLAESGGGGTDFRGGEGAEQNVSLSLDGRNMLAGDEESRNNGQSTANCQSVQNGHARSDDRRALPNEAAASPPVCETPSVAASSPSCGSSVFGSPLDILGRCGSAGLEGGDISDRLLSAINLTRLLAAVRLSSSSADTCTTSPICIGVDRDGRNISVSVSVTPTNPHHNLLNDHDHNNNHNVRSTDNDQTNSAAHFSSSNATVRAPHSSSSSSKTETSLQSRLPPASSSGLVSASCSTLASGSTSGVFSSTSAKKPEAGFMARNETSFVAKNSDNVLCSASSSSTSSAAKPNHTDCYPNGLDLPATSAHRRRSLNGQTGSSSQTGSSAQIGLSSQTGSTGQTSFPQQTGLRFLPSPLEQNAISEILHLRPGETTELDPATIDALIIRLCSHTLQIDPSEGGLEGRAQGGAGVIPGSSTLLQRQELEAVERMLKEMVRASEREADDREEGRGRRHRRASNNQQHSPGQRRAENSDTGYEYDVSTASSEISDQASYDYFLSKAARTRSLECEVKKLIRSSDSQSSDSEEDDSDCGDEEGGGRGGGGRSEAGESPSSASTISRITPTAPTPRPHDYHTIKLVRSLSASDANANSTTTPNSADATYREDSDDGTMADLSESENSSGYYEYLPAGRRTKAAPVSSSSSSTSTMRGRRDRGSLGLLKKGSYGSKEEVDVLDVPCYELRCNCGSEEGESQSKTAVHSSGCSLAGVPIYSHIGKGKGSKRSRHHHSHHQHHHSRQGRKDASFKKSDVKSDIKNDDTCTRGDAAIPHFRSVSLCDKTGARHSLSSSSEQRGCRRGSADAATSRLYSSLKHSSKERPSSSSSSSISTGKSLAGTRRQRDSTSSSSSLCGKTSKLPPKTAEYSYSFMYPVAEKSLSSSSKSKSSKTSSKTLTTRLSDNGLSTKNGEKSRSSKSSKTSKTLMSSFPSQDLDRNISFQSDLSSNSVYSSHHQNSEVYSIPSALPDNPVGGRGMKSSVSMPSKLSVARGQVPESSEVYGTRASLLQSGGGGGRTISNRLLNDVIMANYNNM